MTPAQIHAGESIPQRSRACEAIDRHGVWRNHVAQPSGRVKKSPIRGVRLQPDWKKSASQETNSAEVDINIDEMRRTNHISLARVAANGAASAPQRGCRVGDPAPPGAQA